MQQGSERQWLTYDSSYSRLRYARKMRPRQGASVEMGFLLWKNFPTVRKKMSTSSSYPFCSIVDSRARRCCPEVRLSSVLGLQLRFLVLYPTVGVAIGPNRANWSRVESQPGSELRRGRRFAYQARGLPRSTWTGSTTKGRQLVVVAARSSNAVGLLAPHHT